MFKPSALAYTYDGSFEGLLCCVFESYLWKETPLAVHSEGEGQGLLLEAKWIDTDQDKADRVLKSIPLRISPEAEELVRLGFWSNTPDKEMLLLHFLYLGFTHGPKVMNMLADDTVHALTKAVQQLRREGHLYLGFVRFSVYGPVMAAVIEPQGYVLPVIQDHFCDRFQGESFMIYDRTHGMALIHEPGREAIIPLSGWTAPAPDEAEEAYRRLWTGFYHAIGIKERRNDRLRSSMMPKRYWKHMTEMSGGGLAALPASTAQRKPALQQEAPGFIPSLPASLPVTGKDEMSQHKGSTP
ncbi:TIGR03915 family putative DNA repair protein [Paenibacillus sp. MMS20-IR301]|uniref:TIGR03915 family putative DNA repair protein n=1 Tax=Paenibacillus sp. MMS20-IR301 TaxID=2895946 RepID=UPI0028F04C3A|nr:TIGR03915 family putative DNA repair protein [Paenibacillus sp. MMS20-IR301]WNS42007.1 TIGR03915 family putative DNA repair protein [Paenibacillus sp. MMS20-IR301]